MYTQLLNDSPEIRLLLEKSKETDSIRMKLRYDVLIQLLRGYTRKEVAKIFNVTENTVRNYEKSYKTAGVAGLEMGKSTGIPKKLSDEQESQLYRCIVDQTPTDVGFAPFVNWTANLARQLVERQFVVVYSERGMREVLYRLD